MRFFASIFILLAVNKCLASGVTPDKFFSGDAFKVAAAIDG
ncbi:hypothetical protein [Candidatus Pantoea soli]|nr:hypothetical protein [Pantoea soli]